MWPAILGMTFAILPEEKAGLAGGIILGAAGLGNAIGPLIGGVLTDLAQLALDLLPQRADRDLRRRSSPTSWSTSRSPRAGDQQDRLRRDRGALGRPRLAAGRPRPGRRLGLGRPAGDRPAGARGGPDRRLRADRAPRRHARPGPARGDAQRELHAPPAWRSSSCRRPSSPRCSTCRSSCRSSSATRRWKPGVGMLPFLGHLRRSSPSSPGRSTTGSGRSRWRSSAPPASRRAVPLLAGRRRLGLRLADRRHGRARDRDRQLLPDRDHRRRHLGRRIADQPRRRHRLHVPDRRRLDRPRPDDDRLLRRRSRPSSTASRPRFRLDAALSLVGFVIALLLRRRQAARRPRPSERRLTRLAAPVLIDVVAGAADERCRCRSRRAARRCRGRRSGRRCRGRRSETSLPAPADQRVVARRRRSACRRRCRRPGCRRRRRRAG